MTVPVTAPVVVIGDAIIDALVGDDGTVHEVAGGAALNLAVGLTVLGRPVSQIASLGLDRRGSWLAGYLRDHGVRLMPARSVEPTGVAWSRRVDGEPTYSFNGSMLRRRIRIDAVMLHTIATSPAVVLNAVALDSAAQVADLLAAFGATRGLRVIDPNPRPALISDLPAFRAGFETIAAEATVVKVSDEDLALLYGGSTDSALGQVRSRTDAWILLTRGPEGAVLHRPGHESISVPAAVAPADVVDTLGAGDATLAVVVDGLLHVAGEPSDVWLDDLLRRAMAVAAETAAHHGGLLRMPPV